MLTSCQHQTSLQQWAKALLGRAGELDRAVTLSITDSSST